MIETVTNYNSFRFVSFLNIMLVKIKPILRNYIYEKQNFKTVITVNIINHFIV